MIEQAGEPASRSNGGARVRLLEEIEHRLQEPLEPDEVLGRLLGLAVPRLGDWAVLYLPGRDIGRALAMGSLGDGQRERVLHELRRRVEESVGSPEEMAARLESIEEGTLADPEEHERLFEGTKDLLEAAGVRSVLLVPLRARGELVGALCVGSSARAHPNGELTLVRDVAAWAGLALENARLQEGERRAARVRDDLLAVASHDLKTPLAAIRLAGQLLQRQLQQADVPERARKQAEAIVRSSGRMTSMLSELLDMASLRGGSFTLECSEADLGVLVDKALVQHAAQAELHGVALIREGEASFPLRCDPKRVQQVVATLIGNALKHSPEGAEIRVGLETDDAGGARIWVADQGPGIAPDSLARFLGTSTRARRRGESRGLSLFVARGIVEAHGGRLEAHTEPAHGLRFVVSLPRVQ